MRAWVRPREGRVDVVPADVAVAVELDEGPAAHVDRLDVAREAAEALQLGLRIIHDHILVGVLLLEAFNVLEDHENSDPNAKPG